jgi:hypothetical protein
LFLNIFFRIFAINLKQQQNEKNILIINKKKIKIKLRRNTKKEKKYQLRKKDKTN